MKNSRLTLIALTLASTFAASSALADYRLTAFSDTIGFKELISKDIPKAKSIFTSRDLESMDFFESSNLCVAQILFEEAESAIDSCSSALEKVDSSFELSPTNEKVAIAAVYSNLAVAKAMLGDTAGASIALEKALSLNEKDGNASINYDLISTNLVAGS